MALKLYKALTPSLRFKRIIEKKDLWKGKSLKKLTFRLKSTGGRNATGKITVRHRGGGNIRKYRIVDFLRMNNKEAEIIRIEYDPNRSANIALIKQENEYSYIIAPKGIKEGEKINNTLKGTISKIGEVRKLKDISIGTMIHNVELTPNKGGVLVRSAGTYAILMAKKVGENRVLIKLKSGEMRWLDGECRSTIGVVSNEDYKNIVLGKAGASRWLGHRPSVRGEAMNPVDHPHGGKTRGGRIPVNYTGRIIKGIKTRKKSKKDE